MRSGDGRPSSARGRCGLAAFAVTVVACVGPPGPPSLPPPPAAPLPSTATTASATTAATASPPAQPAPAIADAPPPAPSPAPEPRGAHLAALDRDLLVRSRPVWDEDVLIGVIGAGQPVPLAEPTPLPTADGAPCEGGWYRVQPRGFVCASGHVTTDPRHPLAGIAPRLAPSDAPYPFRYGRALGSPRYRRIPTSDEQRRFESTIAPADPADPPPSPELVAWLASREGPLREGSGTYPGMKVAWSQRFRAEDRSWLLTARGLLVPADRVEEAPPVGPRRFDLSSHPLPFAVALDEAPIYEVQPRPVSTATAPPGTVLALSPAEVDWRSGRALWPLPDGRYVGGHLAVFRARPRPSQVAPGEKWVHVSVHRGALVAYEGDRPVFAALASPGLGGTNADVDFDTPPGFYRIQAKWQTSDMRGELPGGGQWATPQVPWVAYYYGSFAIHGAWWHDRFGRPQSHGCVNVSPADAQWLFAWLEPTLPAGWRAVRAGVETPGTPVLVTP